MHSPRFGQDSRFEGAIFINMGTFLGLDLLVLHAKIGGMLVQLVKGIHRLAAIEGKLLHTTISGREVISGDEIVIRVILQHVGQPLCESLFVVLRKVS